MSNDIVDFFAGGTVGIMGWFFGGLDGFFQVLIAFTVIDYISGLGAAYVKREISSQIGFNGIARKVMIFLFVGIAHILDKNLLGDTATLRTAVCLFYIGNEGISIIENADAMHIKIPQFLKGRFLKFTEHNEEKQK